MTNGVEFTVWMGNALLTAAVRANKLEYVPRVLDRMRENGVSGNKVTYGWLLTSCQQSCDVEQVCFDVCA